MTDIKAILFDFGGVFTDSPFSTFDAMGEQLGAKPGQVNEIMFGSYAEDGDHPWHQLERGEITMEQARDDIMELGKRDHGIALDIYQLFAQIPRDGGIRQVLVERVGELKQAGFTTAIITNNVKEFSDGWRSLLPVDDLFDLVVDSSAEGIRKPDRRIFDLTLSRLREAGLPDLLAQQTIFLDDYAANVEAAAQLGMNTVHVGENIVEAIASLNALLD